MAPNVFHLGVDVQVSVSVFDANQPVTVKIYLQDYPQRQKTFSQVQGLVEQGNTVLAELLMPVRKELVLNAIVQVNCPIMPVYS